MLNDILILDQQWLPNQSDFPPISWPWYRAWPSPIMSGFYGEFATEIWNQDAKKIAQMLIKQINQISLNVNHMILLKGHIYHLVNFTLRSTTNEMISISTSQTFRSWVVIFHLRQPMEFLSLNLYDTPGLAPRMNVLYWGPGDFPVSYSNRDTSRNAWNRHSGSFMVDMGILFSNMKYPFHEC